MTLEKPKREHWVGYGLEPRPQFHEETPRERKKEICGGKLKKARHFGPSSLRAPHLSKPVRAPPFEAPLRSEYVVLGVGILFFFWLENPFF